MKVLSFRAAPKDAFDEFWEAYPKRVSKGQARQAFAKACKIASAAEIIAGALRFADHLKSEGTQMKYIPYPATWLNGERWEDELFSNESDWGNDIDF
jgi:hypothetical protein